MADEAASADEASSCSSDGSSGTDTAPRSWGWAAWGRLKEGEALGRHGGGCAGREILGFVAVDAASADEASSFSNAPGDGLLGATAGAMAPPSVGARSEARRVQPGAAKRVAEQRDEQQRVLPSSALDHDAADARADRPADRHRRDRERRQGPLLELEQNGSTSRIRMRYEWWAGRKRESPAHPTIA